MTLCHSKHKYMSLASSKKVADSGGMESIAVTTFLAPAAICCAPGAPSTTRLVAQSGAEPTSEEQPSGRPSPQVRPASAVRTLARWLRNSVSSTLSTQAISTLSQRDRLGERG